MDNNTSSNNSRSDFPSTIFPWQESQWTQIQSMRSKDRLPHALLITGMKGTGLLDFSTTLASSILCENPNKSGESCQQCTGCKLIKAETHPDLVIVSPEEEGKAIKVDQIRNLVKFTQLQSHSGKRKVIIISPADAMNISSANGLLKTLEEPPGDTLIMLVTHQTSSLPITIRSRCQKIKISASSVHVSDWLDGKVEADLIKTVLASGCGPLFLDEMDEAEEGADRLSLLTDLENLSSGKFDPIETAERWSKSDAKNTLFWLIKIYQDMAKLKSADNIGVSTKDQIKLINKDMLQRLIKLIEPTDIKNIFTVYDKLLEYQRLLSNNTSVKAITMLEDLAIEWTRLSKI